MPYRREIDGLRAIAVLSVIFYHAGFPLFRGGFVGVDIFFVISGFLITSIIVNDITRGSFSFISFYERRARRILPALLVVVLICIPFALAWLSSRDLADFSKALSHLVVFASNFYFTRTTGYFDLGVDLKPLLHTWSLAVEEQFYLLFPAAFLWLFTRQKSHVVLWLGALGLASLLFAQYYLGHRPATAFFLMPSRLWQLLLGAAVAVQVAQGKLRVRSSELGAAVGLTLIVLSVLLFSDGILSPGIYMFCPTIGAVLIILYAVPETVVGRILSSRLLVGMGLISYSAYLWH